MTRSRKPHKAPRKSTKARKPAPRPAPARDPEEVMMEEAAAEMVEVISCPVLVAEDHADRVWESMEIAQTGRDLAVLAGRLHATAPVAAVLADVAQVLDRHARELGALLDRLIPLADHDVPHDHLEPTDDDVREMLFAMFGDPSEEKDDGGET